MAVQINELVADLANCLCLALEDTNLCFCGVIQGATVVHDRVSYGRCKDGGMAWVRITNIYPSVAVNVIDTSLRNCAVGTGVDLELGVMRLAPQPDTRGNPPDEAAELAASERFVADALAVRKAIHCCTQLDKYDYIAGASTPFGPQGGVVGHTTGVAVTL